jgi:hypothetical protein
METSTPVFPNGRVGTPICSGIFVEVPACAAVKELKGPSADPNPAAPAALMKSLRERIPFSPGMIYFPLRWIDSESGFKSLGIVTLERIWRSYWRDMMMSISSSCFRRNRNRTRCIRPGFTRLPEKPTGWCRRNSPQQVPEPPETGDLRCEDEIRPREKV